jgi:hypothetical protein
MEESELDDLFNLVEVSDQSLGTIIREISTYIQFINKYKIAISDEDMDELKKMVNGIVQMLSETENLIAQMEKKVRFIAQPIPKNP